MKKLFAAFFLISVIFASCASTGNIVSENLGECFIEDSYGFSMYIPKGWIIQKDSERKGLIATGPYEYGTPAIYFTDLQYKGSVSANTDSMINVFREYPDFELLQRKRFKTNTGLNGEYITYITDTKNGKIRHKMCFIENKEKTAIRVLIFFVPPEIGDKYDNLFDECAKTFNWTNSQAKAKKNEQKKVIITGFPNDRNDQIVWVTFNS